MKKKTRKYNQKTSQCDKIQNVMGGYTDEDETNDYEVLLEWSLLDWMRDLIRSLLYHQASENRFVVWFVYFFALYPLLRVENKKIPEPIDRYRLRHLKDE